MRNIYSLISIILLVILLYACNNSQKKITPSGNTIKIGVIGPMSGTKQALGTEGMEGIQTARLMSPYLHDGDEIEFVIEDDQNIPELTVKAFKKLVTADKVSAVILLSTSGSALAVNAIADEYKVPVLVLLATHPEISKNTRFVNQLCFDNIFQGKVAALFVRDELLIERVAVFKNPDSFYSSSLADEFIREFRSIEGQVSDVIPVTGDIENYEEIISSLHNREIQLLYLPVKAEQVINISKALQKSDWNPQVMGSDGLLTNAISKAPEDISLLEGFFVIDLYTSTQNATPYMDKVKKFFRSRYKTRHSTYPASGFEATALLMDAMDRCANPAESACINKQIRSTKNFEGLMGKLTMQPNGKIQRPLIVNRIKNKKLQLVVKVY